MSQSTNPQKQDQIHSFRAKIFRSKLKKSSNKQISNYIIKQKIGMGSYAKVYKAIHKPTGQTVAVKVFDKTKMTVQEISNVHYQVQTQKKLFHTNIARIYEFFENEEKIYIFMQICKNGQLFTYINRNGPVSQKFAAKIFKQILSALKYLKQQRLFHRDIKCQNIMFDQNWNAKLVDFGFVTKQQDGCFSKTFCGSPSYTSPQVAKRSKYHSQFVDIWCLGVTLYAMLAGQLPFDSKKTCQQKSNIIDIKYQMKKSFSPEVRSIFHKIFVAQQFRASIQDIQTQEFCQIGYPIQTKFLNTNTDQITIDPYILELLKVQYEDLNSIQLMESITKFKIDSNYSLYYLTIQKQVNKGNLNVKYDISCPEFQKKKKRSTTLKLIKVRNQSRSQKNNSQIKQFNTPEIKGKKDLFRLKQYQNTIQIKDARLRKRDDSPQSPKRILDLVSAYRKKV